MVFGLRKAAEATRRSVASMNEAATSWTQSPDAEEFFARYMNDVGYVFMSWEKGLFAITSSPKKMARYAELLVQAVRSGGAQWQPPTAPDASIVPESARPPDIRRALSEGPAPEG